MDKSKAIKAVHNGHYCDSCKHLIDIDGQKYCEQWDCEFEPKEEEK